MKNGTTILLVLLAASSSACASRSSPEEPRAARTVSVTGEGPTDLLGRASAGEVDDFAARFDEHRRAGRTACCATLAQGSPDLALELARRAARLGDEALLLGLVRAGLEPSIATARRAAPERHRVAWESLAAAEQLLAGGDRDGALAKARDAKATLAELGDALGVADAELLLAAASPDDASGATVSRPTVVRTTHEARLALALVGRARAKGEDARPHFRAALAVAGPSRDLSLALQVEAARGNVADALTPDELGRWLRAVAGLALDRKRPLIALRCALEAQGLGDAGVLESRALVARAQLGSGQSALALETALALAGAARERHATAVEARAIGIAGEAFLAQDRAGEAAGSFERAASLARGAGDRESWVRRSLNLVRAHLHRGDSKEAKKLLDDFAAAFPQDGRTRGRVALARALVQSSREEFAAARISIDEAVTLAGGAGDPDTVEQALLLRTRLGTLGT